MSRFLIATLTALSLSALMPAMADTQAAPFDLPLDGSCEAIERHHDILRTTGGALDFDAFHHLDASTIRFEGLQGLLAVCDAGNDRLVAVEATFRKRFGGATFDSLVDMLRDAGYRQIHVNRPHVGDKSARFAAGDTTIRLNEPHMSRETTLSYIAQDYADALNQHRIERERQQREAESGTL
ncbi:hypothetical protein [Thioalkalivibrio sp. AKL8]|uniref:hypothetical protein n=1 Tax=Thioalkalivibrio sp. AKL8 TaxID=1158156 RepID=UPI00037EBE2C|nr:hypothetical protein [Thioalkalivibrio sp. AKL8]